MDFVIRSLLLFWWILVFRVWGDKHLPEWRRRNESKICEETCFQKNKETCPYVVSIVHFYLLPLPERQKRLNQLMLIRFVCFCVFSLPAAVMSILLYGCTTWTLTKGLEKKLDGNYTRMLRAILNKSMRQHPTLVSIGTSMYRCPSSLLQQCPACLVHLTRMVCKMESSWT